MNTIETFEARARRLVDQEVHACLSSLVSTLATSYGGASMNRDLSDLVEQAFELACPIQDYEGAAEEAGWRYDVPASEWRLNDNGDDGPEAIACTAEDACKRDGLEPHVREVFEYWSVSEWFGRKLQEAGEKVDFDFAGMVVWARTTTGQAIYADGVVERIAAELMKA